MKKLYKKIAIILVSIILTNALLSNVVLADQAKDPILSQSGVDHNKISTQGDVDKYAETGEATGSSDETRLKNSIQNGQFTIPISQEHDRDTNLMSDQSGFIGSMLASIIRLVPGIFQIIMSQCVGKVAGTPDMFTIQNLLMGKYELFDINIFNKDTQAETASNMSKQIKDSVAQWYYTIRNIAIMASLIILLYTAIRMAMSTTVNDTVKYKKMLLAWVTGFALIFILHYLALILINISDLLVKTLSELAPKNQVPFEYSVYKRIMSADAKGWDSFLQAIIFSMLVWYQAKFFFIYLKRVLSNAFLILISPLVTVTYAIDKSNDCKAQAFNSWLSELITNIFVQPMHLLIFLVLLYSAGAIAELYPIIAILFLFGIGKAETVIRGLFKLKGSSIAGVEEGPGFAQMVRTL